MWIVTRSAYEPEIDLDRLAQLADDLATGQVLSPNGGHGDLNGLRPSGVRPADGV
jgi:hypothetical protein